MGWQVAVKSPRAIGGKKLSLHTLQIVERIVLYATLFPPTYLESLPSKISSYSELTDTNLFLFICLCVCFIFTYLSSRFVQVNVWTQHLRYTGANLYQVSYFKYFLIVIYITYSFFISPNVLERWMFHVPDFIVAHSSVMDSAYTIDIQWDSVPTLRCSSHLVESKPLVGFEKVDYDRRSSRDCQEIKIYSGKVYLG